MTVNRWSHIRLILHREVRDQLRDRRTLFMIAVLPLLLYPLMGMSFLQIAQFLQKHPSQVLLVSEVPLPTDPALLVAGQLVGEAAEVGLLHVDFQQKELPRPPRAAAQAAALIDEGTYDLVVCFPAGFLRRMSGAPSGAPGGADESGNEPLIYYSAAKDKSRIAFERMSLVIDRWRQAFVDRTLVSHQLTRRATSPFTLDTHDVAEPAGRRAAIWSKILPFVALVWALTGAFYPAVDLCAGEKERGTLETLLSSPAERSEIVWGKLLTIMLFSLTTSLLNLSCMTFTATFVMRQFQGTLPEPSVSSWGPPPWSSLAWLIVALVPIVALFSALALALAAMAKSTKEGQYYLMPLMLITMPLMMLAMLPTAELNLGSSIIPITGVLLLLRQLMEGEYREALLYALPVVAVTAACCLMAIRWAVDQFNNESVLFRESERFEVGLWMRQLVRDRSPTPSVAEGIMCGLLILMIRFFASLSLPFPETWHGFAALTGITLVALVAAPAVLLAVLLTSQPRATLLLTRPKWATVPAAALWAVCLHPLAMALLVLVRITYPVDAAMWKPLETLLDQAPHLGVLILLMAVLPACCEELAFRGFILSGLRHMGHKWRAIFISSLLFGLAHGVIQQSLLATLFGMVLGYLAIQTGSLLPCITFHAVHNTLGLCSSQWLPRFAEQHPQLDWLVRSAHDGVAGGAPMYFYGPAITFPALILAALMFRWFRGLTYQPSDEERLSDALDHQNVQAIPS